MRAFYLDNDVTLRLADELRAAGHDVLTTRDRFRGRASDDDQLLFAAQQSRILITCNIKDFVLLHKAWSRWFAAVGISMPHAGVLILEQASASDLAGAVSELMGREPELVNQLYEWHPVTGWRRHP